MGHGDCKTSGEPALAAEEQSVAAGHLLHLASQLLPSAGLHLGHEWSYLSSWPKGLRRRPRDGAADARALSAAPAMMQFAIASMGSGASSMRLGAVVLGKPRYARPARLKAAHLEAVLKIGQPRFVGLDQAANSLTRSIAGCWRFLILIQCFDRPA